MRLRRLARLRGSDGGAGEGGKGRQLPCRSFWPSTRRTFRTFPQEHRSAGIMYNGHLPSVLWHASWVSRVIVVRTWPIRCRQVAEREQLADLCLSRHGLFALIILALRSGHGGGRCCGAAAAVGGGQHRPEARQRTAVHLRCTNERAVLASADVGSFKLFELRQLGLRIMAARSAACASIFPSSLSACQSQPAATGCGRQRAVCSAARVACSVVSSSRST